MPAIGKWGQGDCPELRTSVGNLVSARLAYFIVYPFSNKYFTLGIKLFLQF